MLGGNFHSTMLERCNPSARIGDVIFQNTWRKESSELSILTVAGLVGFVALLIVFLILGLIVMSTRDCSAGAAMTAALSGGVTEDVCIAPLCLQAASFVAKNRNVTINPCDDFYKYSCQGWQVSERNTFNLKLERAFSK